MPVLTGAGRWPVACLRKRGGASGEVREPFCNAKLVVEVLAVRGGPAVVLLPAGASAEARNRLLRSWWSGVGRRSRKRERLENIQVIGWRGRWQMLAALRKDAIVSIV